MIFFIGIICSCLLTYLIILFAEELHLVDVPNNRSSHARPTPKGGGIAIIVVFYLLFIFSSLKNNAIEFKEWVPFLISLSLVFAVSICDDIKSVENRYRFMVHTIAAIILCLSGFVVKGVTIPLYGYCSFGLLGFPVTVFWLVGMTNLYNFMDGIDGLAGGVAVIVSLFLFLFSTITGNIFMETVAVILSGSTIGFLIFNFPPAKIFMGDSGSASIGFIFGTLAVQGSQTLQNSKPEIPFIVFIMMLSLFIFDTSATLIRRIIKGERWFAAHRSHFYQRLLALGYSHFPVTLFELMGTTLMGFAAVLYYYSTDAIRVLVVGLCLTCLFFSALSVVHMEKSIKSSRKLFFPASYFKAFLDLFQNSAKSLKISINKD